MRSIKFEQLNRQSGPPIRPAVRLVNPSRPDVAVPVVSGAQPVAPQKTPPTK